MRNIYLLFNDNIVTNFETAKKKENVFLPCIGDFDLCRTAFCACEYQVVFNRSIHRKRGQLAESEKPSVRRTLWKLAVFWTLESVIPSFLSGKHMWPER